MGATIGGIVNYGKPPMTDVVVAFSEAVIDKTYLTWLDVNKLLAAFPQRVKLVGDAVIFQGPVAIVSSMSPTTRHFMQCSIAIVVGVVYYIFANYLLIQLTFGVSRAKASFRKLVIPLITALAVGVLYYYVAGRYLPTQAGVYFRNQLPFYV